MKKLTFILVVLIVACNSEDANDCFQTSGEIIEQVIETTSFDRILVNRNIELIIKDAPAYKITVVTGKNLLNDINVKLVGDRLVLKDNNDCNYVRDYGITKVYIEAPYLTEIKTSSQYDVSSDGILNYENLVLNSEDFNEDLEFTVGDFRLAVMSENLSITSNNLSFFYLEGSVTNLFVGFYSGSGRFEGEGLIAQNVQVYHRGSNDMVVNPQQTLTGELRGTGNLISVNEPAVIAVERYYTGQLLFN